MKRTPLVIVAAGAALAFVPQLGLPAFYDSLLYLMLHWIVLATSWNILSGYSGYFSFGHGAFFGAGMYTTARCWRATTGRSCGRCRSRRWSPRCSASALGAVVFRVKGVRGELFALLTLAITFVIGTIVVNTPIDGGPGVSLSAVPVPDDRADAVVHLLPARARRGDADDAGRLGRSPSRASAPACSRSTTTRTRPR